MINTFLLKKENILSENSSSIIEFLKWVGILSMTLDHIGILIYKDYDFFRMIGRLAFPIFGFVLIYNFMYHTKSKVKYIKRLVLFSVLFETIHFFVLKNSYVGLNIFFIYSMALYFLYMFELVQDSKERSKEKILFVSVIFALLLYVSIYTEYGISGLLLTISFYFTLKYKHLIIVTLFLLALLNAPAVKYILSTLAVVPLGYLIAKCSVTIPRSRYFFYLYYPVHLLALKVLCLYI